MWGSDYPHQEGTWPSTDIALRWTFGCGVPSSELRAMLGENAVRCYRLDRDAPERIAQRIGPQEAVLRAPVSVEQLPTHQDGTPASWAFRQAGLWH